MNAYEHKESFDKSASVNRNLGLIFTSILLYFCIIIGTTSDLQLLLPESKVELPLLQVDVPLFGFYIIAPIIVVGLHLNFLINLMHHSMKVNRLLATSEGISYENIRDQSYPYIYNFYRTNRTNSLSHWITGHLVYFVAYYFPLIILLFFLGRFTDYQSMIVTTIHFSLFLIDALLVYYYHQVISDPCNYENTKSFWQYFINNDFSPIMALWGILKPLGKFFQMIFRKMPFEPKNSNTKKFFLVKLIKLCIYWLILILGLFFFWITNKVCNDISSHKLNNFMDYNSYLPERLDTVHKKGPNFRDTIFGFPISIYRIPEFLKPRIALPNKTIVDKKPSQDNITKYLLNGKSKEVARKNISEGIKLNNRNLNYAHFSSCKLYRIKLVKSDCNYANFSGAQLYNCNMRLSSFINSNFKLARINNGNFSEANLKKANFLWSKLENANLNKANLEEANLFLANLRKVILREANLKRSTLPSKMKNAKLRNAKLQESQFIGNANLQGANLQKANLTKSKMRGVNLKNANLWRTNFDSVNLLDANLKGLELNHVNFSKANLKGANFRGTNLINVNFKSSNLNYTNFHGTFLDSVNFKNASLSKAKLDSLIYFPVKDFSDKKDTFYYYLNFLMNAAKNVKGSSPMQVANSMVGKAKFKTESKRKKITNLINKAKYNNNQYIKDRKMATKHRWNISVKMPKIELKEFIKLRESMVCDTTHSLSNILLNKANLRKNMINEISIDFLLSTVNLPILIKLDKECPKRWLDPDEEHRMIKYYIPIYDIINQGADYKILKNIN